MPTQQREVRLNTPGDLRKLVSEAAKRPQKLLSREETHDKLTELLRLNEETSKIITERRKTLPR
jgi:hypothetical protein